MYRTCDICKCTEFRVKRVIIHIKKSTAMGDLILNELYDKALYMCPVCEKLYKENKLTDNELGLTTSMLVDTNTRLQQKECH